MSSTQRSPRTHELPHLRQTKNSAQLIVNGSPFLMLAAELHNSSLSSASYMNTVWSEMRKMNVNTLLGSVTWETIEPVEGEFDFSELDRVLEGAREHNMHLVLLWFGSFKNAMSTYVPAWVKKDADRFPRVHIRDMDSTNGTRTIELLSPFHEAAWQADARAFAALMRHLREFDGEHNTVLMIQVENETGLLGDARDRSPSADELFTLAVPQDLLEYLQSDYDNLHTTFRKRFPDLTTASQGATWIEVFGDNLRAEEMFMSNAFSSFIGHVAEAGKKEYDIPFYVNCWLNYDDATLLDLEGVPGVPAVVGGGAKPGIYPSGGPVPHCIDLYKFRAPLLDFVAPDLYLHDYDNTCSEYSHRGQPLFIPEQRRDEKGARRVWLAYGTYGCIGCSPFGIDTLTAANSAFTKHYGLLDSMSKHILKTQAERPEDMFGFFFDNPSESSTSGPQVWIKNLGEYQLVIERSFVFGKQGPGNGIVIKQEDNSYLLIGWGFQVTFKSLEYQSTFTGILSAHEKIVGRDGFLTTGRIMNGDETRSGAFFIMPDDDPDYGGFPIAVTIPSRTMVAVVTPYSISEGGK